MLPKQLFRGDDDSEKDRDLKATINHGYLQTNLLKGGDGSKIFKTDLMELVNEHILSRFDASHFLSFTDKLRSAYRFGLNLHTISKKIIDDCCDEIYGPEAWDFALITLDTTLFNDIKIVCPGIYECTFTPQLLKFNRLGYPYTVFLIDAKCVLTAQYGTAKEYAEYDNEWLILPATKIDLNFNKTEFSGILDGACISNVRKFIVDKEKRKNYNIISYD